jgi:hypothetical protein
LSPLEGEEAAPLRTRSWLRVQLSLLVEGQAAPQLARPWRGTGRGPTGQHMQHTAASPLRSGRCGGNSCRRWRRGRERSPAPLEREEAAPPRARAARPWRGTARSALRSPARRARMQQAEESESDSLSEPLAEEAAAAEAAFLPYGALAFLGAGGGHAGFGPADLVWVNFCPSATSNTAMRFT